MAPKVYRLRSGSDCTTLILASHDGKTVKSYDLAPHGTVPPGATSLVVYASETNAPVCSDAPGLGALPHTQPPTVIAPERLAQIRGLDESMLAMLRDGQAPLDTPQPPPKALENIESLRDVLDTTRPHEPAARPPVVSDFVDYILPPETPDRYLETVNGHPRDKLLRFEELSHTYYVRRADGQELPTNGSVTHLAHKYSAEFDRDGCISRMMAGRNWPREEYSIKPAEVCTIADIKKFFTKQEITTTRLGWMDQSFNMLWSCDFDVGRMRSARVVVAERPMTAEEIATTWRIKGTRAANRGTEAHMHVELFLNRDGCDTDCAEFHSFAWFARNVMMQINTRAYRTEWRVFCEVANVAGSIDCVCVLPNGSLGIIDWKRSVKVRETVERKKFGRGPRPRMRAPMEHLPDCDVACYAIQLSLYAHIIDTHYDKKVEFLILAQIHPDDHFYTFVPNLALESAYIMAERRLENADEGTDEHVIATKELARTAEALYQGRREWESVVPTEGIDVSGWRDLNMVPGQRPPSRSYEEIFGTRSDAERNVRARYSSIFNG